MIGARLLHTCAVATLLALIASAGFCRRMGIAAEANRTAKKAKSGARCSKSAILHLLVAQHSQFAATVGCLPAVGRLAMRGMILNDEIKQQLGTCDDAYRQVSLQLDLARVQYYQLRRVSSTDPELEYLLEKIVHLVRERDALSNELDNLQNLS
jgi:hypothetical protein